MLLDLTHTSHTTARTGIQRVARSIHASLGERALAICHDPYAGAWRPLNPAERTGLSASAAAGSRRGARWPVSTRVRGRLESWLGGRRSPVKVPEAALAGGLVVPELFSPAVGQALPALLQAVQGPRVAIFHDAIALQLPELTPRRTVARYPGYLQELRGFDAIAATSQASRAMLVDYWRWLGVDNPPPVAVVGLGVDPAPPGAGPPRTPASGVPVVLSVGSIEGRKNHVALLDAAELLWREGQEFSLRLIGLVQRETAGPALARIEALRAAGRPIRHDGAVRDAAVETAYAECAFTVYPSLMEGFGLPVIESLARGRPCLCSGKGAIGESAAGGGCLTVEVPDVPSLAAAMRTLLQSPATRERLANAARQRSFRSWQGYADDLGAWMKTVRRRSVN